MESQWPHIPFLQALLATSKVFAMEAQYRGLHLGEDLGFSDSDESWPGPAQMLRCSSL